ncbi:MAG TPA: MerC domain-containing protein [Verrucomicrobiae bacterium]|nr:MerC domain-containing protein [Verrucomicrobiae bacterium]
MNAETPTVYKPHMGSERISLKPVASPDSPRPHTHAKLDRLGIWLSATCAVHCMVMPIVLIFFPVLSWIHWSRIMDALVLGVAAVFGLGGCLLSLRHHRDAMPLCLVLAGLVMNATGRFAAFQLGPFVAQTLVIAGPLLMAYALWKDRRLCQCTGHTH